MKYFVLLLAVMAMTLTSHAEASSYRRSPSDTHVNGYHRKDGTYVQPHYRSAPDGNPYNNYGN